MVAERLQVGYSTVAERTGWTPWADGRALYYMPYEYTVVCSASSPDASHTPCLVTLCPCASQPRNGGGGRQRRWPVFLPTLATRVRVTSVHRPGL